MKKRYENNKIFIMESEKKYNFILGDCLESLKTIEDKTVDVVVTSPPYNIGIKYNKYKVD